MRIGFDLDGVLYSWHQALYNELVIYENLDTDFHTFWSQKFLERSNRFWDNMVQAKHLYSNQCANKELVAFVQELSKRHEIYYISNRPQSVFDVTKNWLNRYKFPSVQNLFFTNDKATLVRSLQIDVFVEDRMENAMRLKDLCDLYVVRQPYNEKQLDGYKVINSVLDLKGVL